MYFYSCPFEDFKLPCAVMLGYMSAFYGGCTP